MPTANEVGFAARDRAIRLIARELKVSVNSPASYDDVRAALADRMTFDADMWLIEVLDLVEATAVAEMDRNAWSDDVLPELSADEAGAQIDAVVRKALEEDDAPAAAPGMRM